MKLGKISCHARLRMKQRGISEAILKTLIAYGRTEYDHHGGKIIYFDCRARSQLLTERQSCFDRWMDSYAVLDRYDEIITVGHRMKRLCRH